MSKRSDILTGIGSALAGIAGVGDISVGKYEQVDLDQVTLPALFVFQGADRESESEEFDQEVFEWDVVIEAWCKDSDSESLFSAIHTAMADDPTFSGDAIQSRRVGSEFFAVDPGRNIIAMQQVFIITYSHPNGQP